MACTPERHEAIAELAAGRLGPEAVDEILEHVETCEACSRELDVVAAVTSAAPAPGVRDVPRPRLLPRLVLAAAAALLAWVGVQFAADDPGASEAARLAQLDPLPLAASELRGAGVGDAKRAAMDAYADGDWRLADERLSALAALPGRPDEALLCLYLGLARAQLDDTPGALEAFERARESGAGLVAERAAWYRANALLRAGDVDRARGALGEIRDEGGEYELNAAELLVALDALGSAR